jgi:hypothetical protein
MEVGNSTGVLLSYEFHATPSIGLELSTGFGGSFTVDGAGSVAAAGALFKSETFSASGFVNYHFFGPGNALRRWRGSEDAAGHCLPPSAAAVTRATSVRLLLQG